MTPDQRRERRREHLYCTLIIWGTSVAVLSGLGLIAMLLDAYVVVGASLGEYTSLSGRCLTAEEAVA